ncbi:MAG: hypothetical protein GY842_15430 [bacterium]|nr:hypothetical protein [bacterium]
MKHKRAILMQAACAGLLGCAVAGCSQVKPAAPEPAPRSAVVEDAAAPVPPADPPPVEVERPPSQTTTKAAEPVSPPSPPPPADPQPQQDSPRVADSPHTLGLRPGDLLPEDLEFKGATHQARNRDALVVLWEDAGPEDQPPQRLFVFTDNDGRITRTQWALPGEGLLTGAELFFDFIVPEEIYSDPPTPDHEQLLIGDELQAAITSGDLRKMAEQVGALGAAQAELDMSHWKGALVLGVIEAELGQHIKPDMLSYARQPRDVGEYAFYTVGRVPDAELFPTGKDRWTPKDELIRDRGAWFMSIALHLFAFYDMGGITEPGFDVTIRHHDFWSARVTRIRNLGDRRIRIEDRAIPATQFGEKLPQP